MNIISAIKAVSARITNFFFGKTTIFITILGWILVVSGIILFLQPQKARKVMLAQGFGKIRKFLFFIALMAGILCFSYGFDMSGTLPKVIAMIAVFGIIKGYYLLKGKAYERLTAFVGGLPIPVLRGFAVLQFIVGALMLFVRKRIW